MGWRQVVYGLIVVVPALTMVSYGIAIIINENQTKVDTTIGNVTTVVCETGAESCKVSYIFFNDRVGVDFVDVASAITVGSTVIVWYRRSGDESGLESSRVVNSSSNTNGMIVISAGCSYMFAMTVIFGGVGHMRYMMRRAQERERESRQAQAEHASDHGYKIEIVVVDADDRAPDAIGVLENEKETKTIVCVQNP